MAGEDIEIVGVKIKRLDDVECRVLVDVGRIQVRLDYAQESLGVLPGNEKFIFDTCERIGAGRSVGLGR